MRIPIHIHFPTALSPEIPDMLSTSAGYVFQFFLLICQMPDSTLFCKSSGPGSAEPPNLREKSPYSTPYPGHQGLQG